MPKNADNERIDWHWVMSLDLEHGIGAAKSMNNEGKTNEATKNLKEPLQKGQTAPKTARQQQQQDKPKKTGKGMKM